MPELRPMRDEDVAGTHELATAAFEDLARRLHEPPSPPADPSGAHVRLRRLLATDPGGCWVTEDGGGLAGAGLALMRDGLWGLSLLVVRPDLQSAGIGSALLRRTLEYGAGAHGGIILGSPDARALRAYARAGFALHPTLYASGRPRSVAAASAVRPFEPADHELAAAVDRAVRGAPHGRDLDALADGGCELLTLPGRGYAAHRAGSVKTIAAFDDDAAAALLRTVLARTPDGAGAEVDWITGTQQWAIDVALEARLELQAGGAVCLRGDVGPFRPYLPGGAYL
jgi:GNAT superfamily N-acetyltransferase